MNYDFYLNYEFYIKIIIILITLYLLYYLFYLFDCDTFIRDILSNIPTKENFSIIFKPNKLYRFNNKIYLLDTNNVLIPEKNPLIFNTFDEYKNYIVKLENDIKINFDDIKNNFNDLNLDDIKSEEDMPNYTHDIEYRNKRNSKDFRNFYYENNCKEKVAYCNSDNVPFIKDIYKGETNCKEEVCNIKYASEEQCNKMKEFNDKETIYNVMCNNNAPKPLDMEKKCDSFKKYTRLGNRKLYDKFCIKQPRYNMATCLLGEYFKDNLLEFEL